MPTTPKTPPVAHNAAKTPPPVANSGRMPAAVANSSKTTLSAAVAVANNSKSPPVASSKISERNRRAISAEIPTMKPGVHKVDLVPNLNLDKMKAQPTSGSASGVARGKSHALSPRGLLKLGSPRQSARKGPQLLSARTLSHSNSNMIISSGAGAGGTNEDSDSVADSDSINYESESDENKRSNSGAPNFDTYATRLALALNNPLDSRFFLKDPVDSPFFLKHPVDSPFFLKNQCIEQKQEVQEQKLQEVQSQSQEVQQQSQSQEVQSQLQSKEVHPQSQSQSQEMQSQEVQSQPLSSQPLSQVTPAQGLFTVKSKKNLFKLSCTDMVDGTSAAMPHPLLTTEYENMPFFVQQMVNAVSQDYIVVEAALNAPQSSPSTPASSKPLPPWNNKSIIFERDLANHGDYKLLKPNAQLPVGSSNASSAVDAQKNSDSVPAQLKNVLGKIRNKALLGDQDPSTEQQAQMDALTQLLDMGEAPALDLLKQEFTEVDKKNILDAYDLCYPVANAKLGLQINNDLANRDIFLNAFSCEEDVSVDGSILLLLEPKKLKFDIFDYFPQVDSKLLCHVCLYENAKKVSETVVFTVQPDQDDITNPQKFLFKLSSLDHIVILIKLTRLFAGEHTEAKNNFYLLPEKAKDKERKLFTQKSAGLLAMLSDFESIPFAYGFITMSTALKSFPCTVLNWFQLKQSMTDVQLLEFIADDIEHGTDKYIMCGKAKPISGKFDFTLREITVDPPFFARQYSRLENSIALPIKGEILYAKDVPLLPPYSMRSRSLSLVNDYYIYPLIVGSFTNKIVKNVFITVQLRMNDTNLDEKTILKCFYDPLNVGNWNNDGLSEEGESGVAFKEKPSNFSTEIKCKLPLELSKKIHLLFKFYHVNHKEQYIVKSGVKQLVGYSFLEISTDGKSLVSGDFDLPIFNNLPLHHYLTTCKDADRMSSCTFKVKVLPNSSVFVSDKNLRDFYHFMQTTPSQNYESMTSNADIENLLNGLSVINGERFLNHMPVILHQLFNMLHQCKNFTFQKHIFKAIVMAFLKYGNEDKRGLSHYVKYMFYKFRVLENLLLHAVAYLVGADSQDNIQHLVNSENGFSTPRDDAAVTHFVKNLLYYFSLVLKCMVLMRKDNPNLEIPQSVNLLIAQIVEELRGYIERQIGTHTQLVQRMNIQIANFLRACLHLIDRTHVMVTATRYIELLRHHIMKHYAGGQQARVVEDSLVDMCLLFFAELFNVKNIMTLFLPLNISSFVALCNQNDPAQKQELIDSFNNKHFLFTPFADMILKFLQNPDRKIRTKVLVFYREMLTHQTTNVPTDEKQRIMLVHFEFFLKFLDTLNTWISHCDSKRKLITNTLQTLQRKIVSIENEIATLKEDIKNLKKSKNEVTRGQEKQKEGELKLREMTLATIKNMVDKHETDVKTENISVRDEKRQLACCIIHILTNMNEVILRKWWSNEQGDSTRRIHFLMVLQMCLQCFEYQGKAVLEEMLKVNEIKKSLPSATAIIGLSPTISIGSNMPKNTPQPAAVQAAIMDILSTGASPSAQAQIPSTFSSRFRNLTMLGGSRKSLFSSDSPQVQIAKSPITLPLPKFEGPPVVLDKKEISPMPNHEDHLAFVRQEQYLSHVVSFASVELLIQFIQDNNASLPKNIDEETIVSKQHLFIDPLMTNVIITWVNILHLNQSEHVMATAILYLRHFFNQYHRVVFYHQTGAKSNEFSELLCDELMSLCNYKISYIRKHASALLYILIRYTFEDNNFSIARARVITTLSLSRLLRQFSSSKSKEGEDKQADVQHLKKSIMLISRLCLRDIDIPLMKKTVPPNNDLNTPRGQARRSPRREEVSALVADPRYKASHQVQVSQNQVIVPDNQKSDAELAQTPPLEEQQQIPPPLEEQQQIPPPLEEQLQQSPKLTEQKSERAQEPSAAPEQVELYKPRGQQDTTPAEQDQNSLAEQPTPRDQKQSDSQQSSRSVTPTNEQQLVTPRTAVEQKKQLNPHTPTTVGSISHPLVMKTSHARQPSFLRVPVQIRGNNEQPVSAGANSTMRQPPSLNLEQRTRRGPLIGSKAPTQLREASQPAPASTNFKQILSMFKTIESKVTPPPQPQPYGRQSLSVDAKLRQLRAPFVGSHPTAQGEKIQTVSAPETNELAPPRVSPMISPLNSPKNPDIQAELRSALPIVKEEPKKSEQLVTLEQDNKLEVTGAVTPTPAAVGEQTKATAVDNEPEEQSPSSADAMLSNSVEDKPKEVTFSITPRDSLTPKPLRPESLDFRAFAVDHFAAFKEDVNKLCSRLQNILTDTISIMRVLNKEGCDTYKTEELYYRISVGYVHIPEMRLIWLTQLANYHKELQQFAESAQCYYRMLYIVFDYLKKHKCKTLKRLPLVHNFYYLAPYLKQKYKQTSSPLLLTAPTATNPMTTAPRGNPSTPVFTHEEENFANDDDNILPESQEFTEAGITKLLDECINLLNQAEHYEHACSIYKILIVIHEKNNNYKKLAECHERVRELYENIEQSLRTKSRHFASFYRLVFFGESLPEEINGRSFIYKMPKAFKLFNMMNKVKEMFQHLELIKLEKLPSDGELKCEPGKVYVHITNVKPYTDGDSTRTTVFERNVNLNQFYYEVPMKQQPQGFENMPELVCISKKKTILTVEQHFPSVKSRMQIIETKELILTPIEAATEMIVTRNQQLKECIECENLDVQSIHMILQGAVCANVNGGPMEVVQYFLGEKEKYNEDHVMQLNEACHQFLVLCNRALKMSAQLLQPQQKPFHLELEKGYTQTEEHFGRYLILVESNDNDFNDDSSFEDRHSLNETEITPSNFDLPDPNFLAQLAYSNNYRLSIPRHSSYATFL